MVLLVNLIIPCAGKLFYSSIGFGKQVVCYTINKGYLEAASLQELLEVTDIINNNTILRVGKIDKIINDNETIYRQRIFIKNLIDALSLKVILRLGTNFKINLNNVVNVSEQIPKFEQYASLYGEDIETWLTNCCIVHLHNLLTCLKKPSGLNERAKEILKNKVGYLDFAPLLITKYNIELHTSAVFLEPASYTSKEMFSKPAYLKNKLNVGFRIERFKKECDYLEIKNIRRVKSN